jgi:hypothetical protein
MLNSNRDKEKRHPEFARRVQIACDGNPHVPLPNHGRLGWFSSEIERRFNAKVTIETVRKWFAGETIPRTKMMGYLAAVLEVDHAWLAVGTGSDLSEKERKVRNATADGAVNLVAGLIQICGGFPAFPEDRDKRAASGKVDLYAVIKGAQYAFHVAMGEVTGDEVTFAVPVEAVGATLVLGVVRTGEFSFRFFELEEEKINANGKRKDDRIVVQIPLSGEQDWREVLTFSNRF